MPAAPGLERSLKLLLVDDHRIFAEVLAMRMRAYDCVEAVEAAFTLGAARALVNTFRPDLVLLDDHLDDERGIDLLEDLSRMSRPPDVLMLADTADGQAIIEALAAGAQGWVTKDASVELLIEAISHVARGHMYLAPQTIRSVITELLEETRTPARQHTFVDDLTPRELEVLRCLVSGMTRTEVAERLYLSVNTVRTHIQKLLRHADKHSTLALVAGAREAGVRGIDDPLPSRLPSQRAPGQRTEWSG